MSNKKKVNAITMKDIILKGLVIAIVVTIPSIVAFVVSWKILDNLIESAIIGAVVHFIALGFSLKISKLLLIKND